MLEGFILGFISWLSLTISWWHAPKWFKRFTTNHFLITDFVATLLTYLTISSFSHSLVAVSASIFSMLLTNFTMIALSKPSLKEWWIKS